MAHLPVQCQNCGAKYKIPETFQGDQAKCKACGTAIDVKTARTAAAGPTEPATPARSGGGTRRPREKANKSGRGQKEEAAETPKRSARRPVTASSSRRGRSEEADDQEDGDGRRRYEPKKDNSMMIAGVGIGALAIVAIIMWSVWKDGSAPEDTVSKADEKQVTEPEKKPDVKPVEAAAKKPEKPKKPKRKKTPAKPKEIKTAADIFKPADFLEKFDRPDGLSEEDEKEILGYLDDLREGSGMAAIRAPAKLVAKGFRFIPVAVNRLLELDFAKGDDCGYAFQISEVIRRLTNYDDFGFSQTPGEEQTLNDRDAGARRVMEVHRLTKMHWTSEADMKKYRKNNK